MATNKELVLNNSVATLREYLDKITGMVAVPSVKKELVHFEDIQDILAYCSNQISHLTSLMYIAETELRALAELKDKIMVPNIRTKRDMLESYIRVLKQIYDAASRTITIVETEIKIGGASSVSAAVQAKLTAASKQG